MKRREAIKWLIKPTVTSTEISPTKIKELEAYNMAIEALSEPINCVKCKHYYETEDDTDVHGHCRMDTAHTNLISRADALRELNGACSNWKDDCKVAEIINALPSADAEWIPCSERVPKENEYVDNVCKYYLIQDEYGDMHVAHLSGRGWETIESIKALGCDVIAWMPLPKPYREGGEQE